MNPEFWKKQLGEGWSARLAGCLSSNYMEKLMNKLNEEYANKTVYPEKKRVFRAFRETPWEDVRVVILGQDPYPDGRATGLAYGNELSFDSLSLSPPLKQIRDHQVFHEIDHTSLIFDETLESWAHQGVLMLNTALTVREWSPGSHSKYWKKFTKAVLKTLAEYRPDCIFILWGNRAKTFKPLLKHNIVLEAEAPIYAASEERRWVCDNFNEVNKIIMNANGPEFRILW